MTSEAVAEMKEAQRRAPIIRDKPDRVRLTVSFSKEGLYYRHEWPEFHNGDRPLLRIATVGAERSFRFQNYRLTVRDKGWGDEIGRVPFPGTGIGPYPLVVPNVDRAHLKRDKQDLSLPWASIAGQGNQSPIRYEVGTVDVSVVEGLPQVHRIREGYPKAPHDDWRYSDHRRVKGQWVAHHITDRVVYNEGPDREDVYDLKSIDFGPAVVAETAIREVIQKGDHVVEQNADGTTRRQYDYDPEKGEPLGGSSGMAPARGIGAAVMGVTVLFVVVGGRKRR